MSAYIKLSTNEYPRHIGDIEIDPAGMADYVLVPYVNPPEVDVEKQVFFEKFPVQTDGQWQMLWGIRDLTAEEINIRNNPLRKNSLIGFQEGQTPVQSAT